MAECIAIVIIGAGILGITAAIRLQEVVDTNKYKVIIIARDFPSTRSIDYATPWAGAHYRPIPDDTPQLRKEADLARVTYRMMKDHSLKEPQAGITFLQGIEYLEEPTQAYLDLAGRYSSIDAFSVLPESRLPPGVKLGVTYSTWCLNPAVYCTHLLGRFQSRGGQIVKAQLNWLNEAFYVTENVQVVINCSGTGFGDPLVFPIRGQTCLVSNEVNSTVTYQHADGTWTFIIPRPLGGGTIIGGTKEPRDYNPEPSMEVRRTLLLRASKLFPELKQSDQRITVLQDIVGRRPARRGGMRLEIEQREGGTHVIHAYGAGGRGVELSWGVAEEVVNMFLKARSVSHDKALDDRWQVWPKL